MQITCISSSSRDNFAITKSSTGLSTRRVQRTQLDYSIIRNEQGGQRDTGRSGHGARDALSCRLARVGTQVVEEDGLQVALGSAGENRDNDLTTILLFACFLQCSPGRCTTADADGNAFECDEALSCSNGIVVGDGNDMIDQIHAQGIG